MSATCLPTAQWFLYSEGGDPLGSVYRAGEGAVPVVGGRLDDAAEWAESEVVEFRELRPTCAMRRFRVTIRQVEAQQ